MYQIEGSALQNRFMKKTLTVAAVLGASLLMSAAEIVPTLPEIAAAMGDGYENITDLECNDPLPPYTGYWICNFKLNGATIEKTFHLQDGKWVNVMN